MGGRDRYEYVGYGEGQARPFVKDRETIRKVSEK